jgi:transposase InsO family protein
MGQVLHGSATTTEAIRRAIQDSQEPEGSFEALRDQPEDRREVEESDLGGGCADRAEEALLDGSHDRGGGCDRRLPAAHPAAARRLPLRAAADNSEPDPLFIASLPAAPRHFPTARCRRRQASQEEFKCYPIGYVHIDIAEVQTAEGKLYLFVAIDPTSKFAYVELHKRATKMIAAAFLRHLIQALPYQIHTILTDGANVYLRPSKARVAERQALTMGIQFKNREQDGTAMEHIFGRTCRENGIEHRTTKVKHPWTNGQVERMNRTIKEATVRRFHYDSHDQLHSHLADFIAAYNFGRRLKTLKGLSPVEFICKQWTIEPQRFRLNPLHQMPGLNT